jgi:hypothetical protein
MARRAGISTPHNWSNCRCALNRIDFIFSQWRRALISVRLLFNCGRINVKLPTPFLFD